jgi:hypothetical protein
MSAFYDQASLVLVPSGYKSGKIYAQKPLTTDGQLTFTRASTATRVNASGLIEEVASGVPRLDYLNSSCPRLILEPQRSNLALWSENFDNAAWTKIRCTVTANTLVSPDGNTNADTLVADVGTNTSYGVDSAILTGTGIFTASVFAKKGNSNWMYIRQGSSAGGTTLVRAWFDLNNGTIGSTSPAAISHKIEDYGNGWYRCSMTFEVLSGGVPRPQFRISTGDEVVSFDSDGTQSINLWGAQCEAGAYGTSYVKTEAATVTRLADQASKTGISSLIGQTEGTLFIDMEFEAYDNLAKWIAFLRTGSAYIGIYTDNVSRFIAEVANSGVSQFISSTYTFSVGQRYKLAIAYKANDFAFYVNGTQVATDNSGTVPATSQFDLQYNTTANNLTARTYNQTLLFKTRLSNEKLAEITSL